MKKELKPVTSSFISSSSCPAEVLMKKELKLPNRSCGSAELRPAEVLMKKELKQETIRSAGGSRVRPKS